MLKKKNKTITILLFILLMPFVLWQCSKDGEPGPQGAQGVQGDTGAQGPAGSNDVGSPIKQGTFTVHVDGKLKDGTTIAEDFDLDYMIDTVQNFSTSAGVNATYIYRGNYDYKNHVGLVLQTDGTSLSPYPINNPAFFELRRELDNSTLLHLTVQPYMEATDPFIRLLNYDSNKVYSFNASQEGIIYANYMYHNSVACYFFDVYNSEYSLTVYYRADSGTLFDIVGHPDENSIQSGPLFDLYNKLIFVYNATVDQEVFASSITGDPLYESVPAVPADEFLITNFHYDTTTGVMSFDYQITINAIISSYNRQNPTGHELKVSGSFNSGGRFYSTTVGRKKG